MSNSAGGTQAGPKVDSDKAPAGKGAAASAGVKPPSSHAQPSSSSHYSGSKPVAVVKPTTHSGSHNIGGGSGTSHTSSGQGSHHSTTTAPDMPQASGTTAPDAPPSTDAPKSTSTSTSTSMQDHKGTQAPEIKVESGDKIITPTKYKNSSQNTDFTS